MGIGDWGLGIGDWGLGIGPNPQSPFPNPQSPIPNPPLKKNKFFKYKIKYSIFLKIKFHFLFPILINYIKIFL